jgi:DNA-directed RNA polymerase specialized sigma24 family protein
VRFYASWDGRRVLTHAEHELHVALLHVTRAQNAQTGKRPTRRVIPASDHPHARVFAALAELSARQRECVVLRHYAGMTESEIANAIGCSIGSVRTHYRRGAAHLTGVLADIAAEAVR